jgi:hypothetical protein
MAAFAVIGLLIPLPVGFSDCLANLVVNMLAVEATPVYGLSFMSSCEEV